VRSIETNLSNLITDALRDLIILRPAFNPQNLPVVCVTNGGGIRASIPVGNVTVGGAISVLPFGNTVATVIVTGARLKAALENGVSQVESGAGRFAQVSGIRYLWNQSAPTGSRIIQVQVAKETDTRSRFATELEPLDPDARYLVVTNNFMLAGGDGYTAFTPAGGGANQLDTGLLMVDVVQNYIKDIWPFENRTQTYVPIDQDADGRILRTQSWLPIVTKPAAFVD